MGHGAGERKGHGDVADMHPLPHLREAPDSACRPRIAHSLRDSTTLPQATCAGQSATTEVYEQASSDHPIVSPSPASSPITAERSQAVSLATYFGSCGPICGSLILCL